MSKSYHMTAKIYYYICHQQDTALCVTLVCYVTSLLLFSFPAPIQTEIALQ